MGDVVNLNRFRKKKQREEKAKKAESQRLRHGRTKAEKEAVVRTKTWMERQLDAKRLEAEAPKDDAPTDE